MSESEDILRSYEEAIKLLPQPIRGADENPKPGAARITGCFTEIVILPEHYEPVPSPDVAFRRLAEKYGCTFTVKDRSFYIRKGLPFG